MGAISRPNARKFQAVERTFTEGPATDSNTLKDLGSLTWVDSRTNMDNPGWREAVAKHRGATTPCTGEVYKFVGHTSGLVETSLRRRGFAAFQKVTRRYSGDLISAADILPWSYYSNSSLKTKIGNEALVGFLVKCANARRKLQGGVFIGELRQTLNMIARPGRGIRRLVDVYHRDVRRRLRRFRRTGNRIDPVRVTDANKVASDTWLEYSFGLKPLMSDVKSGAEALAELATRAREFELVQYTARSSEDTTPPSKRTVEKDFNLFTVYTINQRELCDMVCRIKGQVKIEVTEPRSMAQEVFGFKPEDFLPTIWELIPYSWLVDYFTNMGDVIQAWTFPREDLAWFNRTYHISRNRELSGQFARVANSDPAYVLDHTIASPFQVKLSATRFERDATSLGIPTVVFEVPGFSTKWLNIAALAHMRRA